MNNHKDRSSIYMLKKSPITDVYSDWQGWSDQPFGNNNKKTDRYFDVELKRHKASISRGSRVLEIGFGNGQFLSYCKNKGALIVGTEINPGQIVKARSSGYNVVNTSDLNEFDDSSFDLVVAIDVLEHLNLFQIPHLLTNIRKVLCDDGVFIARFPNGDSPFSLIIQNADITHRTWIGSYMIENLCTSSGLRVQKIAGETKPILGSKLLLAIHRLLTFIPLYILNLIIVLLFFPNERKDFLSPNLVASFKVDKSFDFSKSM